jgi:hypothetical protein
MGKTWTIHPILEAHNKASIRTCGKLAHDRSGNVNCNLTPSVLSIIQS